MRSKLFKLIGLLLVAPIISMFVVSPLWQRWRQAQSRTVSKDSLKSIGKALHAYHEEAGSFPPAFSSGTTPISWRVALLPHLGEGELFARYQQSVAWDAAPNSSLQVQRPQAYYCPEVTGPETTAFQAVVGIQSVWPFDQATSMRNVTDGTSNTLMVMDIHSQEVPWLAPQDLTFAEARAAVPLQNKHFGGTICLYADGSVRFLSNTIDPEVTRKLLTASSGAPVVTGPLSKEAAARMRAELDVESSHVFAPPVEAGSLEATSFAPVADVPVDNGQNVIYCPTLTLAWREYLQAAPETRLTQFGQALMDSPFHVSDINPESVRIQTGQTSAAERKVVRDQFLGPEAGPGVLSSTSGEELDAGPLVWCALKKQLAFISRFEAFSLPLTFHGPDGDHKVRSFGVTSHWESWIEALAQMRVLDYRSADDFVIQIGNLNGEDLILAKMPQPDKLQSAIREVTERIANSLLRGNAKTVVAGEQVVIPILELSLYEEFTSALNHSETPSGMQVFSAVQVIQFRLDEQGAILISESEVIGENGHYEPAVVGTRTFIFDKPFLLMLRESPDQEPYFAAWIGNTDLMLAAP